MTPKKPIALTAAALAIFTFAGAAQTTQPPRKSAEHAEHHDMMQSCARECSDCQRACDSCASHCAHMLQDGKKDNLTTLATCRDCATVCAAAAQIVARGGPFANTICTACAEVCDRCGKACE